VQHAAKRNDALQTRRRAPLRVALHPGNAATAGEGDRALAQWGRLQRRFAIVLNLSPGRTYSGNPRLSEKAQLKRGAYLQIIQLDQ
jgi:hypothetical protein